MSRESREKMSKSKKGMYDGDKNPMYGVHLVLTTERKKKLSEMFSGEKNPMYGVHIHPSDETKRKISEKNSGENNAFFGKKHSEEEKQKMRNANKKKKTVICIETSEIYESAHEAGRVTGLCADSIIKCCNGKQKTCGGKHWKYVI